MENKNNEIISTGTKKMFRTGYNKSNLLMPIGKEIRDVLNENNNIKIMKYDVNAKVLTVHFE